MSDERPYYTRALKALQSAHDACFKHPERDVLGMSHGPFSGVNEALGIIDQLESELKRRSDRIEALAAEVADLRDDVKRLHNDKMDWMDSAITTKLVLAEAVEIIRPFASFEMQNTNDEIDNHGMRYQSQWFANATAAARDFITAQEKEKGK